MIKISLLTLLLVSSINAVETKTTTTFGNAIPDGTDKYGNAIYNQTVTIETKNFKVENFWKKFSLDGNKNDTMDFTTISKSGTIRVILETTSACTLDGKLDKEGCSGQKPFLLNNEVLGNPIAGTTNEFQVVFKESNGFSNTDQNGFYPLDILRDDKYYKDPTLANPSAPDRGFFGFFTGAFDYMFSKTIGFGNSFFGNPDIADVSMTPRSNAAKDRRQRYIANIMAGVDKEHRMTKNVDGSSATAINTPVLNTPTSLLHYAEAQKMTTANECQFMFLNLSNDGLMCRAMSGFGMDAWMPFFNRTQTTQIQANYIMGDTENSLLAMTGKIEGVPYMRDIGGSDNGKLSFLQNMLKPMTTMIGFMRTLMFGSSKSAIVADPVERVYSFPEDEAMTMTFAVTNNGTTVDDFANFKLLQIRSVYGDEINSCTVKKKPGFFSWSSWKETFYEGDTSSHHGKTGQQWVDWCQQATGRRGMFDYLTNWSTGGFFNPMNWMQGMFSMMGAMFFGSLSIEDITNNIGRGLILNLKKVEMDLSSPRNTKTFKLLSTD